MSSSHDDPQALWAAFLTDAGTKLSRILAALADASDPALLGAAAGELFALRTGAHLLDLEPIARVAGAMERAFDRLAARSRSPRAGELETALPAGPPVDPLAGPLAAAATALARAFAELAKPDASGAHASAAPLDDATARLTAALAGEIAPPSPATDGPAAAPVDDTTWIPQVDDDLIDPFIDEANERLEGLSSKLLLLEESPHDAELVRALFRDLHTIKGSSGFVGLAKMNRLAHAAEDLVGQVRDGSRAADRSLIDALLATVDGLRAILDRAVARRPIEIDLAPILRRLHDPDARVPGAKEIGERPHGAIPEPAVAHPTVDAQSPAGALPTPGVAAPKQTLRVDFDKLDLLLNLVGELVLNRASLHGGVASFTALGRELDSQLHHARRSLRSRSGSRLSLIDQKWLDDLGRVERVFGELSHDLSVTAARLDHVASELRDQVMKLRMLPIARVFNKYHRTVRELAHTLGKSVHLEVEGADTELDKVLVEQLDDPLLHLVRNAVDHGCEMPDVRAAAGKPAEATLTLRAYHRGSQIFVEVADDGAGIELPRLRKSAVEKGLCNEAEIAAMDDRTVLDLIFRPGFSTATRVSEVSGRGVGMDVVRETITRLKGSIDIASTPGRGTTFTLRLPLTLAIIQVLVVRVGGCDLAIPLDAVKRTFFQRTIDLRHVHQRPVLMLDDEEVPLVPLAPALGLEAAAVVDEEFPVILVEALGESFALGAERLVGKQEIVIKTLGDLLEEAPCVAGATLVGDRVVLILDVPQVIQQGMRCFAGAAAATTAPSTERSAIAVPPSAESPTRRMRVLVAEDSDLIRESLKRLFEHHAYEVTVAHDGAEALAIATREARPFDAVCTDVMMPNLDGYDLTRSLRKSARYRQTPIIMITARGEQIDRVRGFDAGVDEYFIKPLDHGEILRAIARHLRRAP